METTLRRRVTETFAEPRCSEAAGDGEIPSQARPRKSGCVHYEHTKPEAVDGIGLRSQPATAQAVMSSYQLLVCLIILGWSERELARRVDRHQTTITRWVKGLSPVPGEEAAWLETLVAFHVAHPALRQDRLGSVAHQQQKQASELLAMPKIV